MPTSNSTFTLGPITDGARVGIADAVVHLDTVDDVAGARRHGLGHGAGRTVDGERANRDCHQESAGPHDPQLERRLLDPAALQLAVVDGPDGGAGERDGLSVGFGAQDDVVGPSQHPAERDAGAVLVLRNSLPQFLMLSLPAISWPPASMRTSS